VKTAEEQVRARVEALRRELERALAEKKGLDDEAERKMALRDELEKKAAALRPRFRGNR
jgi:hypothetical protein